MTLAVSTGSVDITPPGDGFPMAGYGVILLGSP